MSTTDRSALVAGHRRAADFIETHPDLTAPAVYHDGSFHWSLYSYHCPQGVPAMVAAIRRAVGGKWAKSEEDGYGGPEMLFKREGYTIRVKREAVCVRRVVGTETVTKPAVSLPERTETVEVVEWDCAPLLSEVSA